MESTSRTPTYARMQAIVEMLLALRGHTRHELAEHLDIHVSAISKAYKGKRRWAMDEVESMAEYFDVPVSMFFDEPGDILRSRCSLGVEQLDLFAVAA